LVKSEKAGVILKHFPIQKDFVVNMNHLALEKKYSSFKTIGDAYNTNFIKLSELQGIYSIEAPGMLIESWIMQLALFLDLPVNKDQIKELAWLIFEDNHFLNIAEMTLLFTRIKKGYYGQFFNRIDPVEILRWCREYRKERGNYISKLPDGYESPELKKAKEEYYQQIKSDKELYNLQDESK